MLFKVALAEKIIKGEKTQTRRPVKPGERLEMVDGLLTVMRGHRLRMQQGRDYAVCYGRGKATRWYNADKCLIPHELYLKARGHSGASWREDFAAKGWTEFRILLTDIRCEDVRDISHDDSIAEGFKSCVEFLETWAGFYDSSQLSVLRDAYWSDAQKHVLISDRPYRLYQAWAYTFEIAEVG